MIAAVVVVAVCLYLDWRQQWERIVNPLPGRYPPSRRPEGASEK